MCLKNILGQAIDKDVWNILRGKFHIAQSFFTWTMKPFLMRFSKLYYFMICEWIYFYRNSPSSAVPATTIDDDDPTGTHQTEVPVTVPPGSTEKQKKGVYSSGKKRRIKRLLDSDSDKRSEI